ncbi:biotin/lipoyl-binding protein [Paenibacillus psychroresistens]|uniref:Biotin/lipoyl-binding protein n=1 Tax=Paenibacillus psychroresistens TaxID=1778678 RepID=A0A6B8RUK3_9BACL|nr:efflux RND transporter periplasmic adaptor subunit [Paenibacillus psychroresistens]QGQ99444.1 biotin/lipoyl-binding protein [Paenibacillus psychroresistens]
MYLKWWTVELNKAKTTKVILICLLSLSLVVSAGCSLLPKENDEEAIPVIAPPKISKKPEYAVKTDTMETLVRGSGKIMATKEEELFFTLDGKRIKEVFVKPGDTVEEGQLLAELDVSDIESTLKGLVLDNRLEELSMKTTLRDGSLTPEQMELKKLEFEKKRQTIADNQEIIAKARLVAPFSGTLAAVYVQKGDAVKAYDAVAIVADLGKLTVALSLTPDDLKKVAVGMEVRVDLNGEGQLTGKIAQLPDPKAEGSDDPNNGNGGQGPVKESLSNYLLVNLEKMPENTIRGNYLSAAIIINRKTNVIVIPPSTLRTVGARNYVQVIDSKGTKKEVDVEIGQMTSTSVEIIKGLTVGQKVVGR